MYRTIAAATVAALFLLVGCGTGGGAKQSDGGSESESSTRMGTSPTSTSPPTTSTNRTTSTTPEPNLPDRPPDSTLAFRSRVVTGALGSYCWGSVCADVAGIPVPPKRDTLNVPSGATLLFDSGGSGSYRVDAAAYPLEPEVETQPGPDGIQFIMPRGGQQMPMPEAKDLKAVHTDGRTQITADLPTGEYTLSVFVDPGRGDASYFYRLRVESGPGESSAEEILFARQPPEDNGLYPSAATAGKLVAEDKCLLMKHLDGIGSHLPVWPHDYSLSTENGDIRLLDGEGRIAARLGDVVRVGGGEIRQSQAGPKPEQARRNYQQQRRELNVPPSCPGPLWLVAPVDRLEVIQQR